MGYHSTYLTGARGLVRVFSTSSSFPTLHLSRNVTTNTASLLRTYPRNRRTYSTDDKSPPSKAETDVKDGRGIFSESSGLFSWLFGRTPSEAKQRKNQPIKIDPTAEIPVAGKAGKESYRAQRSRLEHESQQQRELNDAHAAEWMRRKERRARYKSEGRRGGAGVAGTDSAQVQGEGKSSLSGPVPKNIGVYVFLQS